MVHVRQPDQCLHIRLTSRPTVISATRADAFSNARVKLYPCTQVLRVANESIFRAAGWKPVYANMTFSLDTTSLLLIYRIETFFTYQSVGL